MFDVFYGFVAAGCVVLELVSEKYSSGMLRLFFSSPVTVGISATFILTSLCSVYLIVSYKIDELYFGLIVVLMLTVFYSLWCVYTTTTTR